MDKPVDVAVLGSGPAGSSVALALARRGCRVVMWERATGPRLTCGETLVAAARLELETLGIWERFVAAGHLPSLGNRSAWGSSRVRETTSLFNPYGCSWHLDRAAFDELLCSSAVAAGAELVRGIRLAGVRRSDAGQWRLTAHDGDRTVEVDAAFLVDATGRNSSLARMLGIQRKSLDHLIGMVGYSQRPSEVPSDAVTLVESVEEGWWYSACLPHDRMVAIYLTDADLSSVRVARSAEDWLELLRQTRQTRARTEGLGSGLSAEPMLVSANSSRLETIGGEGWLALGDAAMAYDPLSSNGIGSALRSARSAAEVIAAALDGQTSAVAAHCEAEEQHYGQYLQQRHLIYSMERRWPDSAFWQRRYKPADSSPKPVGQPYRGRRAWLRGLTFVPCTVLFILAMLGLAQGQSLTAPPPVHRIADAGIEVEVSFATVGATNDPGRLSEGKDCLVRCRVSDARRSPLGGLAPAAWLARKDAGQTTNSCAAKILSFVAGNLWAAPALALNRFQVIALNEDSTITVIDPSSGFGGSKLIALVTLPARGSDWVLSRESRWLWVALPQIGKVVCIDAFNWTIHRTIEAGSRPERLALEPSGQTLWVIASDRLIALRSSDSSTVAELKLARGPHQAAFSSDGKFLVVSNGPDGSLSFVDLAARQLRETIPCGERVDSIAFSAVSRLLYAADSHANQVLVLDPVERRIVARIEALPGLSQLVSPPESRFVLALHRDRGVVEVVDGSVNRMVQTVTLSGHPDSLSVSADAAYLGETGSEFVTFMPLQELGAGKPIPVLEIPIGQKPAAAAFSGCFAPNLTGSPQAGEMLFGSRADQAIYLYRQGMAAPAGQFNNYSRTPMAVLAVDRGFKEREPGVYEAVVVLPKRGLYEFAFFLDRPRVTACFDLNVDPSGITERLGNAGPTPTVRFRDPVSTTRVGRPLHLEFELLDNANKPWAGPVRDLRSLAVLAPGTWHSRDRVQALRSGGYAIEVTPPQSGYYYIYLEAPSIALLPSTAPSLVIQATSDQSP
jgi:flavin-dependent dehydrogenase/DNA-binding beta-propeller fold protein YncE